MIKIKPSLLLFIPYFILNLYSCKSDKKTQKIEERIESQTLYENFIEIENAGENYKIPSPMEMFIFLEKAKTDFQPAKMHSTTKTSDYVSRKAQSINLGIYSADLAYSSVFGDFQQTLNYFNAAKQLATSLGLHEGFGKTIAIRIDNNLDNIDSLMDITADSYQLANQFLEDQGQSDILGLILVGGWVEGLYLAVESVKGIDIENPIIERIADQQILLENLLAYLEENNESKYVKETIDDLAVIQEAFDELYFNDENTVITDKQFVNISNEVIALRNSYIN